MSRRNLKVAQALGDRSQINRWMVILAVINRQSLQDVATILCLDLRTVEKYVAVFVFYGLKGAPRKKSSGRPGNLKPHQKDELRQLIKDGPDKLWVLWRLLALADDSTTDPGSLRLLLQRFLHRAVDAQSGFSPGRKRLSSRIISMKKSAGSGDARPGRTFCA